MSRRHRNQHRLEYARRLSSLRRTQNTFCAGETNRIINGHSITLTAVISDVTGKPLARYKVFSDDSQIGEIKQKNSTWYAVPMIGLSQRGNGPTKWNAITWLVENHYTASYQKRIKVEMSSQ